MMRLIAKLYPRKVRDDFEKMLAYCNVNVDPFQYLAFITIISFVVALIIGLFVKLFFSISFIIVTLASFFLVLGSIYAWLVLKADARAKFVENLLPDALQLMASNLRSGYTIDKALLLAARPEFGNFQEEINQVGKEVATGKDFNTALVEMASRIKSEKLEKTALLIVEGVNSGGQLSDLLEQTAGNLRSQRLVDERIRSSVLTYVIFIFAAIGLGAPMLFGLSSFLIEVITQIFSQVQLPASGTSGINLPLSFTATQLDPGFIVKYTIVSMVITAVMGSLILGLIQKGREKEGLKFIPVLIILTLSTFFLVKFLISTMLGGLFNI